MHTKTKDLHRIPTNNGRYIDSFFVTVKSFIVIVKSYFVTVNHFLSLLNQFLSLSNHFLSRSNQFFISLMPIKLLGELLFWIHRMYYL